MDTEFTGLCQDTTLVSIGIVSEYGDKFYAEVNDYNEGQVDPWVRENVLGKLILGDEDTAPWSRTMGSTTMAYGDSEFIAHNLFKWLRSFRGQLRVWSDCLAYDWVLFLQLFKDYNLDVHSKVSYIPLDICTLFEMKGIDPDISREQFAGTDSVEYKHNALNDAVIIKKCYDKLVNLQN